MDDAIRLESQLIAYRKKCEELQSRLEKTIHHNADLAETCQKLQSERDRHRKALEEITLGNNWSVGIAREALKDE